MIRLPGAPRASDGAIRFVAIRLERDRDDSDVGSLRHYYDKLRDSRPFFYFLLDPSVLFFFEEERRHVIRVFPQL